MYFYLPLHSLAAAAAASFSSSSKPITVRGGRKRPKPRREKSLSRGGGRPTILYYALLLFPPTPRFFFWLLRRLSFSASSSQSDPSLRKQQQEAQYEEGKQMNQWWNWLAQKEDRDPLYHTYTAAAKEESGAVFFLFYLDINCICSLLFRQGFFQEQLWVTCDWIWYLCGIFKGNESPSFNDTY